MPPMNLNALHLRQYHCLETTVDDPVMCCLGAWSRGGVAEPSRNMRATLRYSGLR